MIANLTAGLTAASHSHPRRYEAVNRKSSHTRRLLVCGTRVDTGTGLLWLRTFRVD